MVLPMTTMTEVAEKLLEDFAGRVSFEALCVTLRSCVDDHPGATGQAIENLTRRRLLALPDQRGSRRAD